MILELKGAEATINSTASTFNNATLVKVIVTTGTPVITITTASDAAVGNTTLNTGIHFIKKHPTEKIAASADVKGTPVPFTVG